jgi:microcystin-dependent protein
MPVTVTIQRPNLVDGDVLDAAALAAMTAVNVTVAGAVATDEFTAYKTQATNSLNGSISALVLVPVGSVVPYAGTSVPANWWACDGQLLSRTSYAALFAVIGTAWGAGDGLTTFGIPDLRGRTLLGLDIGATRTPGATTIGAAAGVSSVALTTAQLPSHTHAVDPAIATTSAAGDHRHMVSDKVVLQKAQTGYPDEDIFGNGYNQTPAYAFPADDPDRYTSVAPAHTHTIDIPATATTATGSGGTHDNMPPFATIRWIIRVR